jgi:hypothetical protein
MSVELLIQHGIAISTSLGAGAWLIARALSPKRRGGPCASCSAYRRTAKRPEAEPSGVVIRKK